MAGKERRNKGEGSITKLDNGKYKVVVTLPSVGKQVRKSKTVATKSEAIKALKELQAKYQTKEDAYKELNKVSFEVYAERFLERKEAMLKPNTYKSYKSKLKKHLIPYIGFLPIGDVKTPHINDIFLKAKDLKASSIKTLRIVLSNIFNSAIDEGLLEVNPVAKSDRIQGIKRKVDMILPTENEMNNLLRVLKEEDYLLYMVVLTTIHTGLRKSELLGLKWDNIDKEKCIIKVRSQRISKKDASLKTPQSMRDIYVNKTILNILESIPDKKEYVFDFSHAKFIVLKNYFKKLNFHEDMTFHDLRHYHATMLLKKGVNIKVISKRLGHKDVTTTLNLYTHYEPEMEIQAIEIVGNTNII